MVDQDQVALNAVDTAVKVLESDGWTQGHFVSPSGERCVHAAVALGVAQQLRVGARDPVVFRRVMTGLCVTIRTSRVAAWNDRPGRTKEEVVQALRSTGDWIRRHPLAGVCA